MSLFVSRGARAALRLEPERRRQRGRLSLAEFGEARRLALEISKRTRGGEAVSAGELVALAALDDFHRAFLMRYLRVRDPHLMRRAVEHLVRLLGGEHVAAEVTRFVAAFGPSPVQRAGDEAEVRRGLDEGLLLEIVLFWLQTRNSAGRRVTSVLTREFEVTPTFDRLLGELERFLTACDGLEDQTLAGELLAPMRDHPDSLSAQVAFVRRRWRSLLAAEGDSLQQALDLIAEEAAPRWGPPETGVGGPPVAPPALPEDAEKHYSDDRDWMAELVLAAKNTLVWLQQLSRAYGREISRLDQIPDAELELLAGRGFSGLWLIGLWERSPASAEIKRRRGNPEAASSAYSLRSYGIAAELGGEEALADLRRRAARYGLRLAADMVPNHMGIDSDWVLDHPERFVQAATSPFPAYSFSGPDLSPRSEIAINLEDHYYDGTDAAVVFRRLDRTTGRETFIYHGNDGTSTPWNDTAQLDYLEPTTREAVLETILDVARRFSVIRFDAAMTLTRRHYQRLWHPQPGDAGAIPSRSEHGLSRAGFDRRMPREFWREVVDSVAREAPDTLLLAEAFWLMEGYFVRTLGLHRVYNSAFMHMMRDRETGKLRRMLEETLSFDPEILRRYVNFMSNPDEEPAVEQFGDGDCYFGACTVLSTLPGLPMFAHGQWDGLREKYGMEYRRAYHDELPNRGVIERHDREIAPLLRSRHRFAGVDHFWLFKFHRLSGAVEDNVLAYANGSPGDAVLVVFNNSESRLVGRVDESTPVRRGGEDAQLETKTVADLLGATDAGDGVVACRDSIAGESYLAAGVGKRGWLIELGPFQAVALDGFRLIDDPSGAWSGLAERLHGRGVGNLERALLEARSEPLRERLTELVEELRTAAASAPTDADPQMVGASQALERLFRSVEEEVESLLSGSPFDLSGEDLEDAAGAADLARGGGIIRLVSPLAGAWPEGVQKAQAELRRRVAREPALRWAVAGTVALEMARAWAEEMPPLVRLAEIMLGSAPLPEGVTMDLRELAVLAVEERWLAPQPVPGARELAEMANAWRRRDDARRLLGAHVADGVEWIVREKLEALLEARLAAAVIAGPGESGPAAEDEAAAVVGWRLAMGHLGRAAASAGYRLHDWV